jgi:hypothetical protein
MTVLRAAGFAVEKIYREKIPSISFDLLYSRVQTALFYKQISVIRFQISEGSSRYMLSKADNVVGPISPKSEIRKLKRRKNV